MTDWFESTIRHVENEIARALVTLSDCRHFGVEMTAWVTRTQIWRVRALATLGGRFRRGVKFRTETPTGRYDK